MVDAEFIRRRHEREAGVLAQGGTFVKLPTNQRRVIQGSGTVFSNEKPAARSGDRVMTCNDPVDLPAGKIITVPGTVFIGDRLN